MFNNINDTGSGREAQPVPTVQAPEGKRPLELAGHRQAVA